MEGKSRDRKDGVAGKKVGWEWKEEELEIEEVENRCDEVEQLVV